MSEQGSESNVNRNDESATIQCQTTGNLTGVPKTQQFRFDNAESATRWMQESQEIRRGSRALRGEVASREEAVNWLAKVAAFHREWGSEKIPDDLRRAVNVTQDEFGIAKTEW